MYVVYKTLEMWPFWHTSWAFYSIVVDSTKSNIRHC